MVGSHEAGTGNETETVKFRTLFPTLAISLTRHRPIQAETQKQELLLRAEPQSPERSGWATPALLNQHIGLGFRDPGYYVFLVEKEQEAGWIPVARISLEVELEIVD